MARSESNFQSKLMILDLEELCALPFKEARQRALEPLERSYLIALSERCQGNQSAMSRACGLSRKHLRELLRKHGLHGA